MTLLSHSLAGHARGWSYTPLRGKVPIYMAWSALPPSTEADIRRWIDQGHNLGIRTGEISNLFVVILKPNSPTIDFPTDTPCVETSTGTRHYYLQYLPGLGNTDRTRGDGGQVLAPGSIHPDTGQPYRWVVEGDPPRIPRAWEFGWLSNLFRSKVYLHHSADILAHVKNPSAEARAIEDVYSAAALPDANVEQLVAVAELAGLSPDLAVATVRAGLKSRIPDELPPDLANRSDGQRVTILIPGPHVDDQGGYHEIGTDLFSVSLADALPQDRLWRRGGIGGELVGSPLRFAPLDRHRARMMVDSHARLVRWVKTKPTTKGEEPKHVQVFTHATPDYGELLIARATDHPTIRTLESLTSYPVCKPEHFEITSPGYNEPGIYYDAPHSLQPFRPIEDPQEIRSILEDLVIDFPFAAQADRENFFGLLLTPILRPAVNGNVPMHLASSPIHRTGKSKLLGVVFGGVILGSETPAIQMTGSDDERDKRILSALIEGQTIANLDNIKGDFIDSPALASLLTTSKYQGRLLGLSRLVTAPNRMTVVASGNNVSATSDIIKRIVPINLAPREEEPDKRVNFQHPELEPYVRENRKRVLEALHGAVIAWRTAGSPLASLPLGGFEDWAKVVGGILGNLGYSQWLRNRNDWVTSTDDFAADLHRFVEAWDTEYQANPVPPTSLMQLAERIEVFQDALANARSPKSAQSYFGKKVLSRIVGRVVAGWRIRGITMRGGRHYWLGSVDHPSE